MKRAQRSSAIRATPGQPGHVAATWDPSVWTTEFHSGKNRLFLLFHYLESGPSGAGPGRFSCKWRLLEFSETKKRHLTGCPR